MYRGFSSRGGEPVEYGCCQGAGCGCGCGPGGLDFSRYFSSRTERIAELEAYLKGLEAEAAGVRERLSGLRGGQPPSPGTPA